MKKITNGVVSILEVSRLKLTQQAAGKIILLFLTLAFVVLVICLIPLKASGNELTLDATNFDNTSVFVIVGNQPGRVHATNFDMVFNASHLNDTVKLNITVTRGAVDSMTISLVSAARNDNTTERLIFNEHKVVFPFVKKENVMGTIRQELYAGNASGIIYITATERIGDRVHHVWIKKHYGPTA